MKINYKLIENEDLTDKQRTVFGDLLKKQGKVEGNVYEKANRCKIICIASFDDIPISIGGIKPKTILDFRKTNLEYLKTFFDYELGYIYTDPKYKGKGIASQLVKLLLEQYGTGNLMASTEIEKNPGMVKILKRNLFERYGSPWKSKIHGKLLGLYLRIEYKEPIIAEFLKYINSLIPNDDSNSDLVYLPEEIVENYNGWSLSYEKTGKNGRLILAIQKRSKMIIRFKSLIYPGDSKVNVVFKNINGTYSVNRKLLNDVITV